MSPERSFVLSAVHLCRLLSPCGHVLTVRGLCAQMQLSVHIAAAHLKGLHLSLRRPRRGPAPHVMLSCPCPAPSAQIVALSSRRPLPIPRRGSIHSIPLSQRSLSIRKRRSIRTRRPIHSSNHTHNSPIHSSNHTHSSMGNSIPSQRSNLMARISPIP